MKIDDDRHLAKLTHFHRLSNTIRIKHTPTFFTVGLILIVTILNFDVYSTAYAHIEIKLRTRSLNCVSVWVKLRKRFQTVDEKWFLLDVTRIEEYYF